MMKNTDADRPIPDLLARPNDAVVKVATVALFLDRSDAVVRKMVTQKRLKAISDGHTIYITVGSLREYLDTRKLFRKKSRKDSR